jgi:hypothetical protein
MKVASYEYHADATGTTQHALIATDDEADELEALAKKWEGLASLGMPEEYNVYMRCADELMGRVKTLRELE